MVEKICKKCLISKSLDFFSKNKKSKDGFNFYCKECDKKKYWDNREKNIERMRDYKKNNSDKIREYYYNNKEKYSEYRIKNKDRLNKFSRDYYKNNKEKFKEYRVENETLLKEKRKEYSEKNKKTLMERRKKYREENKEKINLNNKLYREKNIDRERKRLKDYYEKNKKILIKNNTQKRLSKRKKDPFERVKHNLGNRIREFLKSKKINKNNRTFEIVGCSPQELKIYLQEKFNEGMCWENYGKWHIDHRIPLSSARTEEELYKLSHFTNLQPMWATDNIRKGSKIF